MLSQTLKKIYKNLSPPIIQHSVRKLFYRRKNTIYFSGPFSSWKKANDKCAGYETELIIDKVLNATLKVISGEVEYERDSVLFDKIQYSWPVAAGIMMATAQNNGQLNLLDFGGSLGTSYLQNRKLLQNISVIKWNIVEQDHFVNTGRKHIDDGNLKFYYTIEECMQENQPNVILLSSVLHYLSDPYAVIDSLKSTGAEFLIIDNTIINNSLSSYIYIQNIPKSIYEVSYPCYSLSESQLINNIVNDYNLISDFFGLNLSGLERINSLYKGYIFKKNNK